MRRVRGRVAMLVMSVFIRHRRLVLVGRGGRVGRVQVSKSRGPGFKSHRRRFESWASSFTPRCLSLNECMCV